MSEDHPGDLSHRENDVPILTMSGVTKRFGSTVALDGVNLSVRPGEIHALIGENGAGKSTLMKVLSGVYRPDEGEIRLRGEPYAPTSPQDGRSSGISMIYQELNLAPHLTIEANIFLGMEESRAGWVRRKRHSERVNEALKLLGRADLSPRTIVSDLNIGEQQLVEIARALVIDARLIVLDEPTSSLTVKDTEKLFDVIERLKASGVSVIYISHFLEEIDRIADRFTVLRNGKTVGTGLTADTSHEQIIELMVGRSLEELFPNVEHRPGDTLLELDDLWGVKLPRSVSLQLRRGEILGVAGLIGAGRTEMLRAIYGLDPVKRGTIRVAGVSSGFLRPDQRLRQGVGFLSENRKEEGLALTRSIADNVTLSELSSVSKMGWISPREQGRCVRTWIERLAIRCRGPSQPVAELSGGNQQKIAIARLLHQKADVLLLDEPTRGIDVGSKVEVYRLMGKLAAEGKGIVFVSSYVPELLGVCDRIAVLSRGRLQEIRNAEDWTEHSVLLAATRGDAAA